MSLGFPARLIPVLVALLTTLPGAEAQQVSKKFAHVAMPDEITRVTHNAHESFAGNSRKIWRIDTRTWTADSAAFLNPNKVFTTIQGMAGHGENLYFYVNGDGVYRLGAKGTKPQIVRSAGKDFCKNIEEAYSAMNVDPTGGFLVLYGQNENAVVFDIARGMQPVVVYNDYVPDAYWLGNSLWAGCLDKVVLNKRSGRSLDNNDFINYGENDQHGLTKFYVTSDPVVPEMGETRRFIQAHGEVKRLLYNKANGDLLLCTSSFGSNARTQILKMTETGASPVAEINGSFEDFAAYGTKIVARGGRGFVEFSYGDKLTSAEANPIVTDIMKPKMWKGQTPEPYEIYGCAFMDFDSKGNLWIAYGKDLFVKFRQ